MTDNPADVRRCALFWNQSERTQGTSRDPYCFALLQASPGSGYLLLQLAVFQTNQMIAMGECIEKHDPAGDLINLVLTFLSLLLLIAEFGFRIGLVYNFVTLVSG